MGFYDGGFMYIVPVLSTVIIAVITIVQNHRAAQQSSVRSKAGDPCSHKQYITKENTMKTCTKRTLGTTVIALFIGLSISLLSTFSSTACAKTPQEIDAAVNMTLQRFYKIDGAKEVASSAKALLVMPSVTKAGFILGGTYGQGALRVNGKTERYYNLIAGSAGFTIGAQEMDIILVFMTEKALEEFKSVDGWEAGVTGNVAYIDVGAGKRLDTTALKDAVVAFVFEPKGLMVDASLKGAKFTQIKE